MSINQPAPTLLGPPWPASTTLNEGIIHVGGKPITELAAQFGTPAYILDVEDLRSRARAFKEAFDNAFGYPVGVFYASKAFTSTAVLRWLTAEGLGVDCSTAGELAVALAAGVDPGVIGLHGNNKSDEELTQALTAGVGRIIIDSLTEINRLARVAETLEVEHVPVMIRLTTGVHAGGHEFIATAHEDQKFGLSIASGAAKQAVEHIQAQPRLELMGLHSHIGSQILSTDGFANAARAVLEFRAELASLGIEVEEVDLGGGYGIAYLPGEADLDPRDAANTLAAVVKDESERLNLPPPRVSIEPGRAIVGPTMLTVYEIGTIKQVQTDNG
ncbi:MAG TPA: alanine racemase, partial [Beutenbergiaceae bacterium]|nr:alanine racemase [Beutenbergiaceae bacterium]